MRRYLLGSLAAVLGLAGLIAPARLEAQANTAEMLAQAVRHYEDLQVERALGVLRQIVSPSSPFEVSREQRVQAYTYLGASLALLGRRDSAVVYFRAALERDPFVDLDPQRFTAQERDALAEARRRSFAVAMQPIRPVRIQPGTGQAGLVYMTTHEASIQVGVRAPGMVERVVLAQREGTGLQELAWTGMLPSGQVTPSGVHEAWVVAESRLTSTRDSARIYFTVRHDFPPLEDSLPSLGPRDLLPEHHRPAGAAMELVRGFGVAAVALAAPLVVGNGDLGAGGRRLSGTVAGAAGVAGVVAFVARRRNDAIPVNIAENRRRVAAHAARNAEIAARNRARLAETTLLITPGADASQ